MRSKIKTIEDLRAEIKLLKLKKKEQELYFVQQGENLKQELSSPFGILKVLKSVLGLSGENNKAQTASNAIKADWVTNIAKVIIPFLLNKTVFRGKNIAIKTLMALISSNAISGGFFNQNTVSGLVDKATNWINSSLKKQKQQSNTDYGIPPDSETY